MSKLDTHVHYRMKDDTQFRFAKLKGDFSFVQYDNVIAVALHKDSTKDDSLTSSQVAALVENGYEIVALFTAPVGSVNYL